MAIAWIVFERNVDRRLLLGAGANTWRRGCDLLAGRRRGGGLGDLSIAGACLTGDRNNNLTRKPQQRPIPFR